MSGPGAGGRGSAGSPAAADRREAAADGRREAAADGRRGAAAGDQRGPAGPADDRPSRVVLPAGEGAVLVEEDDVLGLLAGLRADRLPGVVDLVPAERTLLVAFDPALTTGEAVARWARSTTPVAADQDDAPVVDLEVRYDGEDLAEVAARLGTTPAGVVRAHTEVAWRVAFTGFAPGFGYLRPPDGRLAVPRRDSPRPRVPAGSVALAAGYTGIYPSASPGGWQLVGRTDAALWDPDRTPPALLTPGAVVRFHPRRPGS